MAPMVMGIIGQDYTNMSVGDVLHVGACTSVVWGCGPAMTPHVGIVVTLGDHLGVFHCFTIWC